MSGCSERARVCESSLSFGSPISTSVHKVDIVCIQHVYIIAELANDTKFKRQTWHTKASTILYTFIPTLMSTHVKWSQWCWIHSRSIYSYKYTIYQHYCLQVPPGRDYLTRGDTPLCGFSLGVGDVNKHLLGTHMWLIVTEQVYSGMPIYCVW